MPGKPGSEPGKLFAPATITQHLQPTTPSRTALRVALRRAAHQLIDPDPLVFPDPFAIPILGPTYAQELQRAPTRADRPHSHALRAFIVARSRFAEDTLASAIAHGATQYVLLGAGLDTFAFRNRSPSIRVFEVDHPATQAWKLDLLAGASLHLPATATLVPVDFERQSLAAELSNAGFDPRVRTLFAWLGVIPYLTLEAFRSTLAVITGSAPGSGVVLDYGQPRSVLTPLEQLAHDSLSARVALAGEPFRLFFTPAEIRSELRAFPHIEDLGRDELNARYFAHRSDSLHLQGTAGRILSAAT